MSVSVTLVRHLVEEVVRAGADSDSYLAKAGIDRRVLDDASARVDADTYVLLQELALDVTRDPALGLHMAERASLSAFNVVGFLSVHCSTLRQALEAFVRYRRLLSDADPGSLVEQGDEAVLTCDFVRGSERGDRLRAELLVTALILTARSSLGVWRPPIAIEFEHPEPEYVAEYERIFECKLHFNADATRIRILRSLLDVPHIHSNPELYELLDSQAQRLLSSLEASVTKQVHAILLAEHGGTQPVKPTMRLVARRLGVSARSLRRRLQEEGHSYTQVAERAMADVARRLLHRPEATIQEVAHRLGFSEPSAFHRAFKRWTGLTPGQFRERR